MVNHIPVELGSVEADPVGLVAGWDGSGDVDPATVPTAPHWKLVVFPKAQHNRFRFTPRGTPQTILYIVVSESVKLSRTSSFGRTVLAVLGPQEIFVASSVLDPGPRMASATALSKVRAAAIDRHTISSMILEHPRIAEQLLQILSRRGKHAHDELADLVFTDGTNRNARSGRVAGRAQPHSGRDRSARRRVQGNGQQVDVGIRPSGLDQHRRARRLDT